MGISRFFAAIKDGAWHNVNELSKQLLLQTGKLTEFSKFLHEKGLVKFDEVSNRIRIEPIWKLLLPEGEDGEELNEPKPTCCTATLIIPPETSVDVQSTQIRNLSSIELEVSLRIDNKIKEVAIKI